MAAMSLEEILQLLLAAPDFPDPEPDPRGSVERAREDDDP